jgi:hypothetical protein
MGCCCGARPRFMAESARPLPRGRSQILRPPSWQLAHHGPGQLTHLERGPSGIQVWASGKVSEIPEELDEPASRILSLLGSAVHSSHGCLRN